MGRDLLVRDRSGDRRVHLDDARGMIGIDPQQPELLLRRLEDDHIVVLGGLGDFLRTLGNRPVIEQEIGASELDLRQLLVLDGLAEIRKRARDVRASHLEQQLSLGDLIAKARVDFHDASRRQRRHGHLS